jgi:hypothetical protein
MITLREVTMAHKFRLTCARTTYFDVEIAAEDSAAAEQMLEAAIKKYPEQCERVGTPIHRVVEVAPAPDGDLDDGARNHLA